VLYDQRVSMWTCLLGLSASVAAGLLYSMEYLLVYVLWIALSRTIATLLYTFSGHRVDPLYPLVLYYNQVLGSVMKIYALFHMDQQSWTRQKTKLDSGAANVDALINKVSSKVVWGSSLCLFSGVVALLVSISQS
ncbi:MAG: glycosyl transferase, partial [Gammaproteobacteria bacterium]|nr:glycosyl transferase [Gammaproteobacteria bacterium]